MVSAQTKETEVYVYLYAPTMTTEESNDTILVHSAKNRNYDNNNINSIYSPVTQFFTGVDESERLNS